MMTLRDDTPAPFRQIWDDLRTGRLDERQASIWLRETLQQRRGSSWLVGNYLAHLDFRSRIDQLRDKLAAVAPLSLSIAPEYVAALDGPAETFLLLRYPAASGETLHSLRRSRTPIPRRCRDQALDDVRRLFDAGMNHPYLTRGRPHWYYGDRSGALVADAWEVLALGPPEHRELELEQMARWLEQLGPL